ncbi:MAG: UDP-N-acetylglucosamine 2-epimerase (non-hydrolyzing) [Candidatus Roizmanbacteria bacterium]|nr:UDP-N-acetylglucosamine 2-epimerase (non-hydrolyzing) [Candidatus Roizmanbacteria bacterium]
MYMKIVTIIGARPQFIKASAVSRAINNYNRNNCNIIHEVIVHTGQHYDTNMSKVFFDELSLQTPNYNLEISNCSHGAMTGQMLEKIEKVLKHEQPDVVLIYGDTNSTLAGALAAVKLHIPIAHVEAGLRSFNMRMPEEVNRIVADRVSNLLLCPTDTASANLTNEGITEGVYNVGDVMYDTTLYYKQRARQKVILEKLGIEENGYVLCTIHRAENTDDIDRLQNIMTALRKISSTLPVIFPIHPRTHHLLKEHDALQCSDSLNVIEPVSYLEMLQLEMSAKAILTDSGGVQKEAFFHKIPCLTLRDETEWTETVELGWNQLCGANQHTIIDKWEHINDQLCDPTMQPYGDGKAADKIVKLLIEIQ